MGPDDPLTRGASVKCQPSDDPGRGRVLQSRFALALILVAQTGLLGWSATRHSPSIDEVGHLAAGLHHWKYGTFDLYRVNPPLVRLVATAPLAAAEVGLPPFAPTSAPPHRPEFGLGREFVDDHGMQSYHWFAVARWACLPFALLGTVVCYMWARDLYGRQSGLLAAGLWAISPTILAHAQMITPDTGAAAVGAAASYAFWRWLRCPGATTAAIAGLTLGVAELTKTTWVILFPLWPALWCVHRILTPRADRSRWMRQAIQLAAILALAVMVLNLGYFFEDTGRPLGEMRFTTRSMTTGPDGPRVNRFRETWLGQLPVPLPQNYVEGIDVQRSDFEARMRSYLRGEWRHSGWWYYYLYGLLVKTPLATLALFGLALVTWPFVRPPGRTWRDELTLVAPGVVILALVSSQTGFNHHLRYILPAFPFAFVWMSRLAAAGCRSLRVAAWVALGATAAASLWVYPHSLSYFNVAAGGPANGSAHMLDSNVDWGQDLLYLKEWVDAHPEARPLGLAYFGYIHPSAVGIEFRLPPYAPAGPADFILPRAQEFGPRPGWYAVSVHMLRGARFNLSKGDGETEDVDGQRLGYFLRCQPVATAGYSIWIYHLDAAECDRLRADMGLPPLGAGSSNLGQPPVPDGYLQR